MKLITLVLFCSVLLVWGCGQEENMPENTPNEANLENNNEYLIFGHVAIGWGCTSSKLYLLLGDKLYADTTNAYCTAFKKNQTYTFRGYALPDSEYQKVKTVLNAVPKATTNTTYGCPGCADGGMYYIEHKINGKITQTKIDDAVVYLNTGVDGSKIPSEWVAFSKELQKALTSIKTK